MASRSTPHAPRPTPQALHARDVGALGLLVSAWLLFLWPFFAPRAADRGSLPLGDVDSQFYALARVAAARVGMGELPLWNPYSFGGSPLLAEPQAALLYPPRWLTLAAGSLVGGRGALPFALFELEIFAHLLLASGLTYGFARQVRLSRGAATLGALAFPYSSFLTGFPLEQVSILEAAVWLPGVLWGVEAGVTGGRRGGWAASGALALSFLAGSAQMTLYIAYAALLYGAVRGRAACRSWRWLGGHAAGWLGAVALLVLAQAWPTLEWTRESPRATSTFQAVGSGLGPGDLLELFVPHATSVFAPLYIGIVTLFLAAGALRARGAEAVLWVGLAVGSLALAFGSNAAAFGWAYLLVPGAALFRSQERVTLLWAFAGAMLAALGAQGFLDAPSDGERGWRSGGWFGVAGGLAGLAGVAYLVENPAFPGFALAAALTGGCAALGWLRAPGVPRGVRGTVVGLVLLFDLFTINGRTAWRPIPPSVHELAPPLAAPLLAEGGSVLLDIESGLQPNAGAGLGLPATTGASQLRLARYEQALAALPRERWWALWGVTHVATWREALPIPAERLAQTTEVGEAAFLHRFLAPTPRARLVFRAEVAMDGASLWQRLAHPAHELDALTLLEEPPSQPLAGGSGRVLELRIGSESWDIQAEADAPALVWLSLPAYPGWRAWVDGAPTPILRADGLWSAVPLPAGRHTVRVAFAPPGWAVAGAVSGIAWLLWLVWGLRGRPERSRRKNGAKGAKGAKALTL